MADIIPDSHVNRLDFLQNLKVQIDANVSTLALGSDVLAIDALLDSLIAVYQTLVDAENAASAASADADQAFAAKNDDLRALFNSLKANPHFTDGMGDAMRIFTTATPHDPADTKPRIKAAAQPGSVRITGSKDYAELVNIYMRLAGTSPWTLVGIKRKKFPFDDQTPLKSAGVPETREYLARGVINDQEVGQQSDIVTVTFAG